ncbi:hypothetical protein ACTA71_007463 [Dictyostelium dimigraforme]
MNQSYQHLKFEEKGATLQINACEFEKQQILGYIGITYDGSRFTEPPKTPPPSNQNDRMKLLCMVNYVRSFIKSISLKKQLTAATTTTFIGSHRKIELKGLSVGI